MILQIEIKDYLLSNIHNLLQKFIDGIVELVLSNCYMYHNNFVPLYRSTYR